MSLQRWSRGGRQVCRDRYWDRSPGMGGGVFVLGVFVGESIIEGFKQECFIIGTGIRCRNNSSSEVPRE